MTLIEVLAALALLGALLAGVVVAAARHTQQVHGARDRLEALDAADRLLASWVLDAAGGIPAPAGVVPGKANWRWRVSGRPEPSLAPFGCHVGRLEITADHAYGRRAVLATVEFVSNSAVTLGGAPR